MFNQKRKQEEEEINLTPMMNLFVVLIPFLLTSTAFVKLSVINAAVPTIAESADVEPGQSSKELNVSIRIEKNSFHLSGSGDNLSNEELASVRTSVKGQAGNLNYEKLTETLMAIKRKFPKGKTALIFPDTAISYEVIVNTMDAARWGKSKPGVGAERQLLYPNVVLTSLAQEGQ